MTIAIVLLLAAALVVAVASEALARRIRRRNARLTAGLKRARTAAETEERRRTAAFERLPVAALRIDRAGVIREINALARDKFPHVTAGQGLLASFGEHRFSEEVAQAVATGASRTFDLRLFADERRTFRVTVEPITVAAGTEVFVFMTDFTDAVAYQELRSQFSANVSHELRTPLTGLAGLVEALGDPDIDPVTHARFVERASSEIQRLVALISDVLFLSELEATQDIAPLGNCDLRAAIANAVDALGDVAAEHDVTISVDAERPAFVPLTEHMATTVVQNLVENAVKYGGSGSQDARRGLGVRRWPLGRADLPRQRSGDPRAPPAAHLRALLPGRCVALQAPGWHRVRACRSSSTSPSAPAAPSRRAPDRASARPCSCGCPR